MLVEVSSALEGDSRAALAHITICPECQSTLRMCDQLATAASPVAVPATLYTRLDEAIRATGNAADARAVIEVSRAAQTHWQWYTPIFGAVAVGASLVLLAAMAPSTSSRPVDWPALIILSVVSGLALTMLERRIPR